MFKILFSTILSLLLFSCSKSQLSNNEKQLIFDRYETKARQSVLKIVDLKQVGSQHKGKYYSYKEFEIKATVAENCSANLINKIAVDEIITLPYDSIDNTYLRQFKSGEELIIKGVLFSSKETFELPNISNCIFYIKSDKISKEKMPPGCIDGQKYYSKSLNYIKLAYTDIYDAISKNDFKLGDDDKRGLFYWGAMLENFKNLKQFNSNSIDYKTFQTNRLNIWIELYCNFEQPDIICKD